MYDENTQAILLLSSYFSKPKSSDPKPLTVSEYSRFALWLHENNKVPSDLFHHFDEIVSLWRDPKGKITKERLHYLVNRGMAMGLALEKWQRAGIWVVTRNDSFYPKIIKKRLKHSSPPLFYGVGNKELLKQGGLAIIGSRGISDVDEQFTKSIASQAASEGINVISGAARGVDEVAMLAALQGHGTAVGVLADSLLKAATSSKWREHLKRGDLVLISSFYPEAGFNAGNAMARNKYIYTLSNYALSVRSDEGKGGTWSGAIENIRNNWVPMFVKPDSDAQGNKALQAQGALPLNILGTSEAWLCTELEKSGFLDLGTAGDTINLFSEE